MKTGKMITGNGIIRDKFARLDDFVGRVDFEEGRERVDSRKKKGK